MQYSVPQFTDVEDKIIAGLSFKQFGILFGVGVLVFVFYSISKSVVAAIILLVFGGVPALAVAFGKINGRPIYRNFFSLLAYVGKPKIYVFHKSGPTDTPAIKAVASTEKPESLNKNNENPVIRIKQLAYALELEANKEVALFDETSEQKPQV